MTGLVAARHALEDRVVSRLHGKLQLPAHDIARGHHVEQLRLEVLRVRGHEAQPKQPGQPLDLTHQAREPAASLWVVVVVDVLAEKNDLPGAGCDRLPGLGQHSLDGDVALAAAHARHDAESAVVVAALDDADVVADAGAAGPWQRLPK